MKKTLQNLLIFVALGVVFGGATVTFAQTVLPVAGEFKDVSVNDLQVKEATDFAVGEQSKKIGDSLEVVNISKAATQTAEGTNYRMCVEVKTVEEDIDDAQFVLIIVNQNPKKEFSLTSWEADGCGKKNE